MNTPAIDYQPQETFEFDTIESLDALMSPFRLRLLACFREPSTAKAAAEQMDVSATRLYRHLHRLVEHGFLNVVGERPAGKTVEKMYAVAARNVRPSARFTEKYGPRGTAELMRLGFRTVESEVVAAAESDLTIDPSRDRVAFSFTRLRLSEAALVELVTTVEGLFDSYRGESGPIEVSFLGSVIPLKYHEEHTKETQE